MTPRVTGAHLMGALNDPLGTLVRLYGERNGYGLYGAAAGDDPAGFVSLVDAIPTVPGQRGLTTDGQSVNTIWNEMQAMLAAFNASNDFIVSWLTFPVVLPNEQLGIPTSPGFQVATEYGRPSKVREERVTRGYPLEHFDLGDGFTQEYIDIANRAQLLAIQATILNSWTTLQREVVLDAIFGDSNYTDKDGINVKRLYNNDGEVPPAIKRWTHDGTHIHYLFGGGGGFVIADLGAMSDHLIHHGYREFGDSTFVLHAHRDELATIRGLAGWIPAETAEQPEELSASGVVRGLQRTGGTTGFRLEGFIEDWTVVQNNDIPSGFLLGQVSGGPLDVRNPVGMRAHENPSARGLRLIEGNRQNYPLYDSVYDGYTGAGIGQRGSAVIMEDAASYTAPTFVTGE